MTILLRQTVSTYRERFLTYDEIPFPAIAILE